MKKIKKIIDTLVSNILCLSKQASKHTYAYERGCSYLVTTAPSIERRVKA